MVDKTRVDPINRTPIVKPDGAASLFFATQWQKLINLAVAAQTTAQQAIDALAAIGVLQARNINTTGGLQGGGDLSADRTLSLTDTGVTPGAYTTADITVDAKGRITLAASGTGGTTTFTGLTDTPASYTGEALKVVRVNAGETALEFVAAGGGTFLSLTDTPSAYTGQGGKLVAVNSGETALEFVSTNTLFTPVTAVGTGASQNVTLPVSGLTDEQVGVFVNGIRYETDEYSIAGTTLTLTTNASGDSIEIIDLRRGASSGSGGSATELDYDPPLTTDLATEVKSSTSFTTSVTDVTGKGLLLFANPTVAGSKTLSRLKTPPATPFTITIRMRQTPHNTTGDCGIILHNSTNNRSLRLLQLTTGQLFSQSWSNLETFNATISSSATVDGNAFMVWMRVTVDGAGNVDFFFSYDGAYFKPIGSTTLAAYLTAAGGSFDGVGVFIRANGINGESSACFHYYNEA